jgi:hypothetical protein
MDRARSVFILCTILTLSAGGGCGAPTVRYTMIPIEGVVTLEGEPLVNADVMFDSEDGPRGFGTTDDAGRFSVVTRQYGAGLPAGRYRVFVAGSDQTRLGGSGRSVSVPTLYQETGVGRVTIGPGMKPLSFDLERKPSESSSGGQDDSGGA